MVKQTTLHFFYGKEYHPKIVSNRIYVVNKVKTTKIFEYLISWSTNGNKVDLKLKDNCIYAKENTNSIVISQILTTFWFFVWQIIHHSNFTDF